MRNCPARPATSPSPRPGHRSTRCARRLRQMQPECAPSPAPAGGSATGASPWRTQPRESSPAPACARPRRSERCCGPAPRASFPSPAQMSSGPRPPVQCRFHCECGTARSARQTRGADRRPYPELRAPLPAAPRSGRARRRGEAGPRASPERAGWHAGTVAARPGRPPRSVPRPAAAGVKGGHPHRSCGPPGHGGGTDRRWVVPECAP